MPDGRFCSHLSVLDPAPLRPNVAGERRQRNAPANVADEPRAGPQRGGVWPPNSSGTPDKGPLAGAAERIGSRRFANGSAVHRQTRRMEPPGCTRSEQSDVCESGGSSATLAMKSAFPILLCVVLIGCADRDKAALKEYEKAQQQRYDRYDSGSIPEAKQALRDIIAYAQEHRGRLKLFYGAEWETALCY